MPISMVLCWFVSNVTEALIGASFVRARRCARPVLARADRAVGAAALPRCCRRSSTLRSCAWSASARATTGAWCGARRQHAATLIFSRWPWRGPPLSQLAWQAARMVEGRPVWRPARRHIAAARHRHHLCRVMALLYLPMPFMIWAALRFGPRLTSASFAGGLPGDLGRWPWSGLVPARDHGLDALPIQWFRSSACRCCCWPQ
jgi:hypothetical protein